MTKLKIFHTSLVLTLFTVGSSSLYADPDDKTTICGTVKPILSVADVNANGIVDQNDINLITDIKKSEQYLALYDFDTNGKIDEHDIKIAQAQLGQTSQKVDQQLALLYNRNQQFQFIRNTAQLNAMGYNGIPVSFAGHGEHWSDSTRPIQGDSLRPPGLNVPAAHDKVSGMYWRINATPVFDQGATDYPTPGGAWETQKVVSFLDPPPVYFDSPDEKWHKHGALCITIEAGGSAAILHADQFISYAQCQSKPSILKNPLTDKNYWLNIYMLHAWIFDLNPNGVFANTHPCVDPNTIPESTINGNRDIPPFFQD